MPLNYLKTAFLLAVLTGIFVALGGFVGGEFGLAIAFVIALAMNGLAYWKSDTMVLRMFKATEVDVQTGGQFYQIVAELARRAELPMPRVYIMQAPQPNAFATGRDPAHAAVCASTGLLDMLSPEEVSGVIAHELGHVKNHDTLTMMIAATIGGAISMIANWLQISVLFFGGRSSNRSRLATFTAMLLAPVAASLVQMAISRSREYQADRFGAMLTGNPAWLASALRKIHDAVRRIPNPTAGDVPATAHLFIMNPLTAGGLASLFMTHPSTESRIAELKKLAVEMGVVFDPASVGEGRVTVGMPMAEAPDAARPRAIRG